MLILMFKYNSLKEVKVVRYDTWNKKLENNGKCEYICRFYFLQEQQIPKCNENLIDLSIQRENCECIQKMMKESIGYITYRRRTGQIGLFRFDEQYRNKGLGKQILLKVIEDLPERNEIFAVTTKNHPFWSNVFDKSFKWSKDPHNSVTGEGYLLEINKNE